MRHSAHILFIAGLLHYVRNESKRSAGCGKGVSPQATHAQKTMSLRASAATRGNPVDDVAQHIFVNPKCGDCFSCVLWKNIVKLLSNGGLLLRGVRVPNLVASAGTLKTPTMGWRVANILNKHTISTRLALNLQPPEFSGGLFFMGDIW